MNHLRPRWLGRIYLFGPLGRSGVEFLRADTRWRRAATTRSPQASPFGAKFKSPKRGPVSSSWLVVRAIVDAESIPGSVLAGLAASLLASG